MRFTKKMGTKFSFPDLSNDSYQVVMVGLDDAGKSTIMYRLKAGTFVQTLPTIGFNREKFKPSAGKAKGSQFTVWDVGGQEKLRPLWRSYYVRHTDAIVFVVDSSSSSISSNESGKNVDKAAANDEEERLEEARLELHNLLLLRSGNPPADNLILLTPPPILLMANKQDLLGALPVEDLERRLGITGEGFAALNSRLMNPIRIIPCCGITGEGLESFFDDLYTLITDSATAKRKSDGKSDRKKSQFALAKIPEQNSKTTTPTK